MAKSQLESCKNCNRSGPIPRRISPHMGQCGSCGRIPVSSKPAEKSCLAIRKKMPAKITIVNMYTKVKHLEDEHVYIINTTSKSPSKWETDLSPFALGPCDLYEHNGQMLVAQNMENAWQYSKVYDCHADSQREPTQNYWTWAQNGWRATKPHRYPMGRGAKPLYSLWNGEKLGYIEARKKIYAPLYAEAVQKTNGWQVLKDLYEHEEWLILRDYDGYDYETKNMTLTEVLNYPRKKMGHAFVLAMLLLEDKALQEIDLRGQRIS